jgi:hypothetical protein
METIQSEHEAGREWGELPGDCLVYRAVLNRPFREKVSGKILRGAFLRRAPKPDGTPRDVKGLSVSVYNDEDLTENQIIEIITGSYTCHAIGKLMVKPVRDIDTEPRLDVIRDQKNHANIEGLPRYGENIVKAERLAGLLADLVDSLGGAIWWDTQPTANSTS